MTKFRKVLLADPVMVSHSLLYYEAALTSTGFEDTEFTIATVVIREEDRQRGLEFARAHPRVKLIFPKAAVGPCYGRWQCWRGFARAMRAVEAILQAETYDLVAYLAMDLVLVQFAFPALRRRIPAHMRAGVSGTLFRDNGLRPPVSRTFKERAQNLVDRWMLPRALRSGGIRKASFLDHWCADRARELFRVNNCGHGIDPVFPEPCDSAAARARFNLKPDDFVFLLFGVLSDRKGILETLAMLRDAPLDPGKTVLLVAGPAAPEIRQRLQEELAAAGRKYRVIRDDRFISRTEMPAYFAAADCAVCVYKDFSGSSSVLLHGAVYGKTAIVSPGGVMEDAVRRHGFGEVAGIGDSKGFTAAVVKLATLSCAERERMGRGALAYGQSMDARRYMLQFI